MKAKDNFILFDGTCNLCDKFVSYLLQQDKKNQFHLVALESAEGEELLLKYNVPVDSDTVLFITDKEIFTESDVVIEVCRMLGWPWKFLLVLKIIPGRIRNKLYRWVAKNRYKWFGVKTACRSI